MSLNNRIAKQLASIIRTVQGLSRTNQFDRSTITTLEGEGIPVGEILENAIDTQERVDGHAEDLAMLDDASSGLIDDVVDQWEMAEEESEFRSEQWDSTIYAIEQQNAIEIVVDEAQAKADQAAEDALGAVSAAQDAATKAQEALDAAGRSVVGSVIEYAVSDSKETAPTTGWSTNAPAPEDDEFVWMRTVVTYADESTAVSDAVLMSAGSGEVVTILGIATYYANMVIPEQPPIPAENPPGHPWYPLKTPYQTGHRLYAADLVVYSDESFAWMNITIVQEWENAGKALDAAQRAQSTADGRNRIFAGVSEPVEDPNSPFVGGDLWYRTEIVEGQEVFDGVSMWDGTEWKDYRLVADSVLVPGSVGNVLIEDGGITAEKIAASFYYGREFHGGAFIGGDFRLDSVASATSLFHDPCETSGDWKGATGAPLSVSTTQAHEGTRSILVSNTGNPSWRFAERTITPVDLPNGGYVEAWVYATVAQRLTLYLYSDDAPYSPALAVANIHAGAWTAITVNASPRLGASRIKLEGPQSSGSLYLDDVRVVKYDTFAGLAGITRDPDLRAIVYSADQGAQRVARLRHGELDVSYGTTKIYTDHTSDPWFGAVATLGIMAEARHLRITSRGLTATTELRLQGSQIVLDAPTVTFAGDTSGWIDVPVSDAQSGSFVRVRIRHGVGWVVWDVTFNSPVSSTNPNFVRIPEQYRPSADTPIPTIAGGNGAAFGILKASGYIDVRNGHTSALDRFRGYGSYLLD